MCLSNKMLPTLFDMEKLPLPSPSFMNEIIFPAYSWLAQGTMTLITRAVHVRENPPRLFICPPIFFSIYFPLRPDSTMALQLSGDPVVLGADKVLNRLWGGLEVI